MYLTVFVLALMTLTNAVLEDVRLGVTMCDGFFGQDQGETRYTPWLLQNGGGWSVWASDVNYRNPDGIRIGVFGKLGQTGASFQINDLVLRACIQLTDRSTNERGNYQREGVIQCTPWVSEGAGWSDWASDNNWRNHDAVRVQLETRDYEGLVITDLQTGLRATDRKDKAKHMGQPQLTQWLVYSNYESYSWSNYAGDRNFRNGDSIKIYLRAVAETVEGPVTPMAAALAEEPYVDAGEPVEPAYQAYQSYQFKQTDSADHSTWLLFAVASCLVVNGVVLSCLVYQRRQESKMLI